MGKLTVFGLFAPDKTTRFFEANGNCTGCVLWDSELSYCNYYKRRSYEDDQKDKLCRVQKVTVEED
jgi:hypothetical protein